MVDSVSAPTCATLTTCDSRQQKRLTPTCLWETPSPPKFRCSVLSAGMLASPTKLQACVAMCGGSVIGASLCGDAHDVVLSTAKTSRIFPDTTRVIR